jgi:REP element-mobilizing transposase RayT
MARKPRIEFEGAFYHVIARGNQRQQIFKDKEDYGRYLRILADYKVKYDYSLYAYVLMNNHVHLLIETKQIPLSRILQGVNQSYTMYFNRKYETIGHLFQGRYKAILCDKDAYLLSLVKYIHLNPIRAKVVESPEEYLWSSHRLYVERTLGRGIVDVEHVLGMFSENVGKGKKSYRIYMGERKEVKREDIYSTVDQRVLGDERFVENVVQRTGKREMRGKRKHEYTLPEIATAVEEVYRVTLRQLREKGKGEVIHSGRKVMSLVAKEYGYKGQEIAGYFWRDPAVITRYLKEGRRFQAGVEKIHEVLRSERLKQ